MKADFIGHNFSLGHFHRFVKAVLIERSPRLSILHTCITEFVCVFFFRMRSRGRPINILRLRQWYFNYSESIKF